MENKGYFGERDTGEFEHVERPDWGSLEVFPERKIEAEVDYESGQDELEILASSTTRKDESKNDTERGEGVDVRVERNAESIPKAYVKEIAKIEDTLKDDPAALQERISDLKRDYIRQAFDRELGGELVS